MFIQFHDILPGSGVRETVEHAMGSFQENLASTGMIRTRALRGLAGKIDTSKLTADCALAGQDMGLGAGVGNDAWWGNVSTLGEGTLTVRKGSDVPRVDGRNFDGSSRFSQDLFSNSTWTDA